MNSQSDRFMKTLVLTTLSGQMLHYASLRRCSLNANTKKGFQNKKKQQQQSTPTATATHPESQQLVAIQPTTTSTCSRNSPGAGKQTASRPNEIATGTGREVVGHSGTNVGHCQRQQPPFFDSVHSALAAHSAANFYRNDCKFLDLDCCKSQNMLTESKYICSFFFLFYLSSRSTLFVLDI